MSENEQNEEIIRLLKKINSKLGDINIGLTIIGAIIIILLRLVLYSCH